LRAGLGGPSPELVGCRWTARAAPAVRAGRRVPAGGRTGNENDAGDAPFISLESSDQRVVEKSEQSYFMP